LFYFQFHRSTFYFILKLVFIFFTFLFVELSQSYAHSYGVSKLTYVNLFFFCFFRLIFFRVSPLSIFLLRIFHHCFLGLVFHAINLALITSDFKN
jgi:hypothetical protein